MRTIPKNFKEGDKVKISWFHPHYAGVTGTVHSLSINNHVKHAYVLTSDNVKLHIKFADLFIIE